MASAGVDLYGLDMIWVWVKITYLNNWMVNTKLDIHICGPLGFPFWPTSIYGMVKAWFKDATILHTLQQVEIPNAKL